MTDKSLKHVIIGSGVVGQSTGQLLESHGEDVTYYDTNHETITKLQKRGKSATEVLPSEWDIVWICTHEKHTASVIPTRHSKDSIIIIRCTVEPSFFDRFDKYDLDHIVHIPEFLRESNSIEDTFQPDRVIIGSNNSLFSNKIIDLMKKMYTCPIIVVPHAISAYIKLISNAWLSTQISFWNEVHMMMGDSKYKQVTANTVALDHRISKYGTIMTGTPFTGKCLPKDIDHIINMSGSDFFKQVKKTNEMCKNEM